MSSSLLPPPCALFGKDESGYRREVNRGMVNDSFWPMIPDAIILSIWLRDHLEGQEFDPLQLHLIVKCRAWCFKAKFSKAPLSFEELVMNPNLCAISLI
ncbi:hypothetical protein GQ457_13G014890 [Hibiscus cannabinus]